MFKFFKEKVKKFFKTSSEEVEKKAEKEIKEEIKKETKKEKKIEKEEKKGLFKKFKEKFSYKLDENKFDDVFSGLEEVLIESNVAMEAIDFIKDELKKNLVGKEIKKGEIEEKLKNAMSKALNNLLIEPFDLIDKIKDKKEKPYIICFFGINGSGKTTTIAKLCKYFQKHDLTCVLAASDTFRAASIEQLEKHASKLGVKLIKHQYGADPAAVAFDAIKHAKAQGTDVVLIDTAGRMHTQGNLMQEMQKITRVSKPDIKIFVGEAIVGNDAIEQAKTFNEKIGIDAIILSKADIDEKAGATISVSYITKKPIIFLGIGQEYKDIEPFDKGKIIKQMGF